MTAIKFIKNIIMTLTVQLCTVGVVCAAESTVKSYAAKYGVVMFAIVFFSVIIYTGLTIYNKFFVPDRLKDYSFEKDSLHSPIDREDAIYKFIKRNRLK